MKKLLLFSTYKPILIFAILTVILGCSTRSNLAENFFDSGNYEKAALEYKKIIENNPQNWKAYVKLGKCYINMNQIEPAFNAYTTALKLNPNLNNIKDNIKEIQKKLSHKYISEKEYDKVLQLNPEKEIQLNISEKFISEMEYRKAYKILEKILKSEPDNITANYQLAVLYNKTDRPGKAKIYFDKIIRIDPDNNDVLSELKLISERKKGSEKYFRTGKELYDYEVYYEAYETFKKSVELIAQNKKFGEN